LLVLTATSDDERSDEETAEADGCTDDHGDGGSTTVAACLTRLSTCNASRGPCIDTEVVTIRRVRLRLTRSVISGGRGR
jgi:hypothetical protein